MEQIHEVKGSDVDYLHIRLREEIARIDLKMEIAAREIGETSGQGLRDVVNGRKRLTAEMLAKLIRIGVDAQYILTGRRAPPAGAPGADAATAEERALLAAWRALPPPQRAAVLTLLAACRPRAPAPGPGPP